MPPQTTPSRITARKVPHTGQLNTFIRIADSSTDTAKVEPTERSMPPEIITIDKASTTSPSSANWRPRSVSVVSAKNFGTMAPNSATSITSARNGMALSIHFLASTSPTTWSGM